MDPSTIVIMTVTVALLFDFCNGWNDSANAIATVVSTRVLTPLQAVTGAAILNCAGAFISLEVAKMIAGKLVNLDAAPSASPELKACVLFGAMVGASVWVIVCTLYGMPISGSHSLLGAMFGAAVMAFGTKVVIWKGWLIIVIALVASPLLGFIIGYILLVAVYWIAYPMRPRTVRKNFGFLQIISSGYMAVTHGMNDAQKAMGVITLALMAAYPLEYTTPEPPVWVVVSCAVMMGLGTAAGGWRVIKTLGSKLAHIRPIEGFAAETAAGTVLAMAGAVVGVPVSTTHTITGSIMGVGTAYSAKSVQWGLATKILWAWVLTLPATAAIGALFFVICRALFGL